MGIPWPGPALIFRWRQWYQLAVTGDLNGLMGGSTWEYLINGNIQNGINYRIILKNCLGLRKFCHSDVILKVYWNIAATRAVQMSVLT